LKIRIILNLLMFLTFFKIKYFFYDKYDECTVVSGVVHLESRWRWSSLIVRPAGAYPPRKTAEIMHLKGLGMSVEGGGLIY
jgi:hypothetical protein